MTFQFLCTDAMSSVLNLLSADDTSQTQCFSPYGVQKHSLTNTPGFNGERRDPLTGLTHLGNGYRAYNPQLMRFQAPDSISPFGKGGINSYVYCEGDPVNCSDPSGHMSTFDTVSIVLGSIVLSIGLISAVGVSISAYRSAKTTKNAVETLTRGVGEIAMATSIGTDAVASSTIGMVSHGHKGKTLAKGLAGPLLDIVASGSGIASAVEHDQGNKQAAKILGLTSLAFFGLSLGSSSYEIYELAKNRELHWKTKLTGTLVVAGTAGMGFGHETAAVTGFIQEKDEGDGTEANAEAPDNPSNGYVTQNSSGLSAHQDAFTSPQSRPGYGQMNNSTKPQLPTMGPTTNRQTNSRLLF